MVSLDLKPVAEAPDNAAEKYLIQVMSCVLEQFVSRNDLLPFNPINATVFHATLPPTVSIKSYLERILKFTNVSSGCLIASLIYIDRFIKHQPSFTITSLNIHRLLITSVMTSMKFLDDLYYNNSYYAKVGGVPCAEINSLELQFLFRLNFRLHISQEEYEHYHNELFLHLQRASSCSCASFPSTLFSSPTPYAVQSVMSICRPQSSLPAYPSVAHCVGRTKRMGVALPYIPWHGA